MFVSQALALAVEKTHINKHSQGLAVSIEDKRNVIQQVNRDVDQLTSILSALTQVSNLLSSSPTMK